MAQNTDSNDNEHNEKNNLITRGPKDTITMNPPSPNIQKFPNLPFSPPPPVSLVPPTSLSFVPPTSLSFVPPTSLAFPPASLAPPFIPSSAPPPSTFIPPPAATFTLPSFPNFNVQTLSLTESTKGGNKIKLAIKKPNTDDGRIIIPQTPSYSRSTTIIPNSQVNSYRSYIVDSHSLDFDPNTQFSAIFPDASSFKSLIEYMEAFTTTAYFYLTASNIRIIRGDDNKTITTDVNIDVDQLYSYEYISENDVYIFEHTLKDIKECLKAVGKTSAINIYKTSEDSHIYIAILSAKSINDVAQMINVIIPGPLPKIVDYELPTYNKHPNVKLITASNFKTCGDGTHDRVTLDCYERGIQYKLGLVNSEASSLGKFIRDGDISSEDENIDRIIVSRATMKALNKIDKLSDRSIIKLYFSPGQPLCIEQNLGHYGLVRTYLNSL